MRILEKRLLMMNQMTLPYDNVASTAKNYASSLKDIAKVYCVNAVGERGRQQRREPDEERRSRRRK